MDVSIIVVTHNSRNPVSALLESLERHPPACDCETIVIDNASRDGTPDMVRKRFPRVRVTANEENVGYARGVNQGIRLAAGRAFLVLNPDIEIRDDAVDRLLSSLDARPRAGIVASRLVYADGRLQHSCRTFYTASAILLRRTFLGRLFPRAKALRTHLMSDWDHETARPVDWVIGACMMARREAVDEVGMMDERFFLYFEDIDWCFRMRHHGWEVWYDPDSTMVHRYERSSRSMLRKPFLLHVLSLLRYVEKWNRFSWFFRRHRETLKTAVFVLADVAAVNAAFFAAYHLRGALQHLFVYGLYPLDWYRVFILFANVIFIGVFAFTGLYRVRRGTHWTEESIRVARAVFLVFAILLAATYLGRIRIYSRAVLLSQAVFSVVLVTCFRRFVRLVHRQLVRARFDLKRVLLVGAPEETAEARRLFTADRDTGIDVVGVLTEGNDSLCGPGGLSRAIEQHKIQEIVVLPAFHDRRHLLSVLLHGGKTVPVRLVSPLASFLGPTVRVDEIGGLSFFSVEGGGGSAWRRSLRRLIDVAAGLCLGCVSAVAWTAAAVVGRAPRRRTETRHLPGGKTVPWPRAMRRDGREASDLLNPALFVYLLGGRLTLSGPPALSRATDLPDDPPPYRPGIAGRWRYAGPAGGREAVEDELLAMRGRRFTGDLVTIARSLRGMAAGRYPEWFSRKDER